MTTPQAPGSSSPSWSHCGNGADPGTDPIGCRGIHVPGYTACLAHMGDTDRTTYLTSLTPGADVDHRGTSFTGPLLQALLQALQDIATGKPRLGAARLDGAHFFGNAEFDGAEFSDRAGFARAEFSGDALFTRVKFSGDACFDAVQFSHDARFNGAHFSRDAEFRGERFSGTATFTGAEFSGNAWFDGAHFSGDARFDEARFALMSRFGPVVCVREVDLSAAVFEAPVTLEIAAHRVRCERTRWEATATLRLRLRLRLRNHGPHPGGTALPRSGHRPPRFLHLPRRYASGRNHAAWLRGRGAGGVGARSGRRAPDADRHRPERLPVRWRLPPEPAPPGRPLHLRPDTHRPPSP